MDVVNDLYKVRFSGIECVLRVREESECTIVVSRPISIKRRE